MRLNFPLYFLSRPRVITQKMNGYAPWVSLYVVTLLDKRVNRVSNTFISTKYMGEQ